MNHQKIAQYFENFAKSGHTALTHPPCSYRRLLWFFLAKYVCSVVAFIGWGRASFSLVCNTFSHKNKWVPVSVTNQTSIDCLYSLFLLCYYVNKVSPFVFTFGAICQDVILCVHQTVCLSVWCVSMSISLTAVYLFVGVASYVCLSHCKTVWPDGICPCTKMKILSLITI